MTMMQKIELNNNHYHMYLGFASSKIIDSIADVPNFKNDAEHELLAHELLTPPIRSWQRPFIQQKIDDIAKIYAATEKDNVMPNPIILSTNPLVQDHEGISVKPTVRRVQVNDVEEIEVNELWDIKVDSSGGKPLWILDGQHRTFGMKATADDPNGVDRSDLPIPFILLHGENYDPPMLAEIFTYVTSGAKEMDPIHKYWMHYSFKLGRHAKSEIQNSMKASIALCDEEAFESTKIDEEGNESVERVWNIFKNRIKFNPRDDDFSGYFSFNFSCASLSDLISKQYYTGNSNPLEPKDLAAQICFAVRAFYECDKYRKDVRGGSVLFDNSINKSRRLSRLATAFVHSTLEYLRVDRTDGLSAQQWIEHLKDGIREFDRNDWSMNQWRGGGLDGASGNRSDKLAKRVFLKYLKMTKEEHDDIGNTRIIDFLWGTGRKVKITAYVWNDETNKVIRASRGPKARLERTFDAGGGQMQTLYLGQNGIDRIAFTVEPAIDCVDIIRVVDGDSQPNEELSGAKAKRGENILGRLERTNPGSEDKLTVWITTEAWSTHTKTDQKFEFTRV